MNILHVGPDSHFVQFLGGLFQSVSPGSNTFLTLSMDGDLRYPVRGADHSVMRPGAVNAFLYALLRARKADAVIAHGLSNEAAVAFVSGTTPVKVWSGWGYDYYDNSIDELLAPATLKLLECEDEREKFPSVRKAMRKVTALVRQRAVGKADFFSAPIPTDFDVMRRGFPNAKAQYLQLNYGDVGTMFEAEAPANDGGDILIGNSASATNNHEDVFKRLADFDVTGRKLIVPLNYGNPDYRELVIRRGRYYFGDAFFPIVEYMQLNNYVSLIASCSITVMGHRRQQALGNIGASVYHGAHLYLDPACPTYQFLMDRGVSVGNLYELEGGLPQTRKRGLELERDRCALAGYWGHEVVRSNVERCVQEISRKAGLRAAGRRG